MAICRFGLPLKEKVCQWRCFSSAYQWVESSKEKDSFIVLCAMWWRIKNNITLIMELPTKQNIHRKNMHNKI